MELTLKNYKSSLSKDLLSLAKKCAVRECDEVEKGSFQSYVDEKDNSFDVLITIIEDRIENHTCDCDSKREFCQHKTALILFIIKGNITSSVLKNKKKTTPLETLITEVDPEQLKEWLKIVLTKNKDLGIAFMQHFSTTSQSYTVAEVKEMTFDAVKAVLKTRKKADTSEIKRITELWSQLHDAVLKHIYADLSNPAMLDCFHAIIEAIEDTRQKIKTAGQRIEKYLESLLSNLADAIESVQDTTIWIKIISFFTEKIMKSPFEIRLSYLSLLTNLFTKISQDRKVILTEKLAGLYVSLDTTRFYDGGKLTQAIFDMVIAAGLFKKHYKLFKPVRFNNEFNYALITMLIEYKHFSLAANYCKEQIKGNIREEFNYMYQEFLKEIYTILEDDENLADVLKETVTATFNFEDFQFVYNRMSDEVEKKNWRSKVLARARAAAPYSPIASIFCLRLVDSEGNYKKMIEYISDCTPYSMIALFAEKMILSDKNAFLKKMFEKSDSHLLSEKAGSDALIFLSNLMHKYYTALEIKQLIKVSALHSWARQPNLLVDFISQGK